MNPYVKAPPLLLLLLVPGTAGAQFNFTTNKGAITITGYSGPGGALVVPNDINGLPVTCIARASFYDLTSLTSVTIPDTVTNIADYAFGYCYELTHATLGKGLANIGDFAFSDCWHLTNVSFQGNAPRCDPDVFFDDSATVYYAAGTTGWAPAFAGCKALMSNPASPTNSPIAVAPPSQSAAAPAKSPGAAGEHVRR